MCVCCRPVRIHPNLRSAVYCSAMASGGHEEWEFGWTMFRNATVASEADTLMSALACTTDLELLKRCVRVCVCNRHPILQRFISGRLYSI